MLNECTFTRPLFADGKPTRYIAVLSYLDNVGPKHRHDILKTVWNVTDMDYHEFYRGYMSTLFASMHRKGIVEYDHKTYKWSITDRGKKLLEDAKKEWGRRYAEKYWN